MQFSFQLLSWYDQHQRQLPWRGSQDAYVIWISEIILQQTRVEQGESYFHRFLAAFPDVYSLAAASEEQLLFLWQGLGYYSRARNLHQAACTIVDEHGGCLPDSYEGWLRVKGVGPYTAAAIASICFQQPIPALDGNLIRVLARVFALDHPAATASQKLAFFKTALEVMDHKRPGDFNQAMMDLGATVCKPANPICGNCPLSGFCIAFAAGKVGHFPVKAPKGKAVRRFFNYFMVFDQWGRFQVQKRRKDDIWKSLYELTLVESTASLSLQDLQEEYSGQLLPDFGKNLHLELQPLSFRHQLTHQTIHADFYMGSASFGRDQVPGNRLLVTLEEFENMPKSRLTEKFFQSRRFNEWRK